MYTHIYIYKDIEKLRPLHVNICTCYPSAQSDLQALCGCSYVYIYTIVYIFIMYIYIRTQGTCNYWKGLVEKHERNVNFAHARSLSRLRGLFERHILYTCTTRLDMYTDSAAPDQPEQPHSLTSELHCPLYSVRFLENQGLQADLELYLPYMSYHPTTV